MKSVIYALGMALALSCCSTKEENTQSSASSEAKSDTGVNHLYSFFDFCSDDPGCGFSGFSDKESFGRWSCTDTATIELMVAPKAEITVKLDVNRVMCPENVALEMNVEVNGEKVSHYSVFGNSSVYVNVPKENIGADGSARLMFIFETAAQPGKYNPENKDPRKLGFALSGVTVYGYCLKN